MEEKDEFPTISMRDVIYYWAMTPEEKTQARVWTSIKILVYWIEDPEKGVLYVGRTKRGILSRIGKHIKERTSIGVMIESHPDIAAKWSVSLFPCDSVEQAVSGERDIIANACPLFNRYHNPNAKHRRPRRSRKNGMWLLLDLFVREIEKIRKERAPGARGAARTGYREV